MANPKIRTARLRSAPSADGGLAIYDEASDEGHLLNGTAAAVYGLADGTRSVEAIARQLSTRDEPVSRELVLVALDELERAGLLEEGAELTGSGMQRRQFLSKLSLVAGAAAVIPLVQTVSRVSQATQGMQPQAKHHPTTTPGDLTGMMSGARL